MLNGHSIVDEGNPSRNSTTAIQGEGEQLSSSLLNEESNMSEASTSCTLSASISIPNLRRRYKKERLMDWSIYLSQAAKMNLASITSDKNEFSRRIVKRKKKSSMTSKHENDSRSGGVDAVIPSAIGVIILIFVIMARLGFRGRSTVAGIDLGTTNSVICVQAPSKSVGEIVCISDPSTKSPVIPSVVSFLDNHHLRSFRLSKEERESAPPLVPHPIDVLVGQAARDRINTHPHHTVYHAKRIIGRNYNHESVASLINEVDFEVVPKEDLAVFKVPYHLPPAKKETATSHAILTPSEIGSYIINHLRTITRTYLRHDNIQSAVIAIPAKFEASQRDATIRAFELSGLKVVRILEEPTAAALAYGLHKREDVHYVMVYDFGGGTLDVSVLYVGEGGFIDVLGSDGDEQLGGADFDAAVAHWLLHRGEGEEIVEKVTSSMNQIQNALTTEFNPETSSLLDLEDLMAETCPKLKEIPLCTGSSLHMIGEQMKITISSHPGDFDFAAKDVCFGLSSTSRHSLPLTVDQMCEAITPVTFSLTLREYDHAVDHLYKRSVIPIQRLLKTLDLKIDEIDEVVMVGGTTRMPQIRDLVRRELRKKHLNTHIDPDLTVAYGAASVLD